MSIAQIAFYRKNRADYEFSQVTMSATENSDGIFLVRNRTNKAAWGTTGSVDANNTQILCQFNDVILVDSFFLLQHNFSTFLLEWFNDNTSTWTTLINVSTPQITSDFYSTFSQVATSQLRLTIFGTQVPNSDKTLCQFIATTKIAQLNGWPIIQKPLLALNIIEQPMLSGKSNLLQNVGYWRASFKVSNWKDATDLTTVETLYGASEGFLVWPCGGNENQFSSVRQGYRMRDLYLCRCMNEFSPEWVEGLYLTGMAIQIDLKEVVT